MGRSTVPRRVNFILWARGWQTWPLGQIPIPPPIFVNSLVVIQPHPVYSALSVAAFMLQWQSLVETQTIWSPKPNYSLPEPLQKKSADLCNRAMPSNFFPHPTSWYARKMVTFEQ